MPESWEQHCAEQERWLNSLPKCEICGESIQDEYMYKIEGQWLCEACKDEYLNDVRKHVDDYLEEQKGEW